MGKFNTKEALRHLAHDYAYLIASGQDTQKHQSHPFNHYAERTFHVHCRSFEHFFGGRDARDMTAKEFTDGFVKPDLPVWNKWKGHIDKHLMHLAKQRVSNKVIWTGEPNKDFLDEFRRAWADFCKCLRPDLKPLLRTELSAMEEQFDGVRLIPDCL